MSYADTAAAIERIRFTLDLPATHSRGVARDDVAALLNAHDGLTWEVGSKVEEIHRLLNQIDIFKAALADAVAAFEDPALDTDMERWRDLSTWQV
jgi:hypothetical protein